MFDGLFDDASLFPPAELGMRDALGLHAEHLRAWYSSLVGPFVVPLARLDEMRVEIASGARKPDRVILLVALDAISTSLSADGIEVRASSVAQIGSLVAELRALGDSVRAAIELDDPAAVAALAGTGVLAKFRTGGATSDAFPTAAMLGACIDACVRYNVAFKCTAGLHHPVRHTDPFTGFEHHGFLNVLLGVDASLHGEDAAGVLDERDPATVVARFEKLGAEQLAAVRSVLVSIGTCSIDEPVNDLVALGLLSKP